MDFSLLTSISDVQIIAEGRGIRERNRLRRQYGEGHWRKLKGFATARLSDGTIWFVELHWYEAHGIGKKEIKLKRLVEERGPTQ